MEIENSPRKRKPKANGDTGNRISRAVSAWLLTLDSSAAKNQSRTLSQEQALISQAPKRWVVYEPMVMLPSGSFKSDAWRNMLSLVGEASADALWRLILHEVSMTVKGCLTHLAVNEGIPLNLENHAGPEDSEENILRSPSGLRILYGDFGPAEAQSQPSEADFNDAFWVLTRQNGIYQIWAPRWTMFSRGNVKEKARLLDFHKDAEPPTISKTIFKHRSLSETQLRSSWAVDLYAGIGYFAFSYAKLGMRVLCWELNPWSVEGLRRGAAGNGWSVRIVQGDDLKLPVDEIMAGGERVVVFLEDNIFASTRIRGLRSTRFHGFDLLHVNCGFLPSSEPTWQQAWEMTSSKQDTWLHLHENIGVKDIESRRQEVQHLFDAWALETTTDGRPNTKTDTQTSVPRIPSVEHVELVKTFAPGVWHCVFDVYITSPKPRPRSRSSSSPGLEGDV
jgi:tRNA wybutosine-synthesizing protein 2